MMALSASELLAVWEQGQGRSPIACALLLLTAASPDLSPAKLSIGRRDALLLSLREWLFGSRLVSLAVCPGCSRSVEVGFDLSEVRVAADGAQPEALTVRSGGYEARFRLPNSEDLEAVVTDAKTAAAGSAPGSLLSRCLLEARRTGRKQPSTPVESARELPPALVAAIAEKMEQADPQANVRLNLSCADCGRRWQAVFDIASYLWSEIDHWARRVLRETHLLASAYGWREADILAMSALRRRLYLEMVLSRER
jgi:hypothetical protein